MSTLLAAELDAAKVLGQRQTTAVQLIKALGCGWHESELSGAAKSKPASAR